MPNINKVVFGNQTLIDLSTTTLSSASQLESGVTAYARDGSVITGTGSSGGGGSVTQDQDGYIVIPPNGGGSSGASYKKGTYTPSTSHTTAENVEITSLATIGFTPKKFVLYPTARSSVSGVSATLVYTMYDADSVIRLSVRYSNTSGTLGRDCAFTGWTTQANYYLYCDGTKVYFRTGTNYHLESGVSYTWEAYG